MRLGDTVHSVLCYRSVLDVVALYLCYILIYFFFFIVEVLHFSSLSVPACGDHLVLVGAYKPFSVMCKRQLLRLLQTATSLRLDR